GTSSEEEELAQALKIPAFAPLNNSATGEPIQQEETAPGCQANVKPGAVGCDGRGRKTKLLPLGRCSSCLPSGLCGRAQVAGRVRIDVADCPGQALHGHNRS